MKAFKIQGFGPIGEGWLDISPLTVLIGPNGCGKSYAAMALHSLNKTPGFDRNYNITEQALNRLSDDEIESLEEMEKDFLNAKQITFDQDFINRLFESYFDVKFGTIYQEELEDTFASRLWELITVNRNKIVFEFETEFGIIKTGYFKGWGEIRIEDYPAYDKPISLSIDKSDDSQEIDVVSDEDTLFKVEIPVPSPVFFREPEGLIHLIILAFEDQFQTEPSRDSFYLPAPRGGFLESHGVLAAGAFQQLSRAGMEPIEVPAFTGAVSNFLSEVAGFPEKEKGELAEIAENFEREVFGGEVLVEEPEQGPQATIKFKQYDREFPFYLTSTGITELAPLSLFTKYRLSEGSMLVIEEPEAHLHPENQRNVANYLARLIQNGVKIIVTTHSDFFLEQLNNLIRLSQVEKDKRSNAGLGEIPVLSPEDVAVNMFYSTGQIEYSPEPVPIDGIDGIPLDQFEEVSDELYGEAYQIDKLLREELK